MTTDSSIIGMGCGMTAVGTPPDRSRESVRGPTIDRRRMEPRTMSSPSDRQGSCSSTCSIASRKAETKATGSAKSCSVN